MRLAIIFALLIFWLVLAFYRFKQGDNVMGGVFLAVGIALTAYRLRR